MGYMGGVLGFMLSVMLRIELSSVGLGVIRKVKEVCLYNNWISVHGLVMLFVFVMPVGIGYYGNYLLPMLIGSSEMSMPRVNGMSYVMLWIGIMLFVSGNVCMSKGMCGGWTLYPPLSSRDVDNMSISMDVCIISIHLLGLSSTMGSMNMLSTSRYGRHNGLLIYGVNLYVFSLIITSVLLIGALPLLAICVTGLLLDRNVCSNVYDNDLSNTILYQHMFWFFGHTKVLCYYILPILGLVGLGVLLRIIMILW